MDQSQEINEFNGVNPYDYYNFYIKNSRLFGLVWFILTVCFTLALIIVFIQPNWVGDTQGMISVLEFYFKLIQKFIINRKSKSRLLWLVFLFSFSHLFVYFGFE